MDKNDILVNLIIFLATRVVTLEAQNAAIGITMSRICKVDIETVAQEIAVETENGLPVARSQFLQSLESDPRLAWLAPEVSEMLQ
jgi:hypothetical protein